MEIRTDRFEKTVDLKAVITVMVVDNRQGIEFHLILTHPLDGRHHPFKSGFTSFRYSVAVVEMFRTINGDTDQELMLSKKPSPPVINQYTIGLYAVLHRFTMAVALLVLNDGFEKIKATEGWLTTLPGKADLR